MSLSEITNDEYSFRLEHTDYIHVQLVASNAILFWIIH